MALFATEVLDTSSRAQSHFQSHFVESEAESVRTVRRIQELEEFRQPWDSWCNDPDADMDSYLASARCKPEFVRPHVMVVYRQGRPDCMLVGLLERCRLKLKVGPATVSQPKVFQLLFLQGGLLGNGSEENCRILVREIRRSLKSGEADGAELRRLSRTSNLSEAARSEFNFLGKGHFMPLHEHRWLELPASFPEFLQGLSRKNRHEIRRHEKKVVDDFSGRMHVQCYRLENEVDELAHEVEKVSVLTYQRALGVGFRPETEILESLRVSARHGGLRGCVLYLDQHPCAFFIGKQYKNSFHGNFMGFDPKFSRYSPGLLVLMHCIEECFDPNMRATHFDLGWGDRQYKRAICNHSRLDGPVYLYAPSWRGLKLNVLRSSVSFLDGMARKLLARSALLKKLRKRWQGNLRSAADSDLQGSSESSSLS